jgi:predicted membrane-bound spermidine synthase
MRIRLASLEHQLLGLFIASGFAGLIYQSVWSHYLGLSLGHAAYAQTLVLAIFMGGMALGAWLVSRYGSGWRRLILAYAVVEIVIGLAGLAFHPLFVGYTGLSQGTVYPALDSVAAVRAWQWGSAALLIAPQSILLGMTFPLMSGGYLRLAPRADGEILGGLYFTNSIGAAAGALAATFLLLPWVGMPGAVAIAGGVNLGVGLVAWAISRRVDSPPAVERPVPRSERRPGDRGFYTMMLAATCVSGAASFVYEIGWIRLLNQALGTTLHSFELMLAAFILGLAFGGLWIRKRSRTLGDPVAYAGYAQIFMGIAALVSIPLFSQSFHAVGAMVGALPRTDLGYTLFSLGSAGISLLVMFPAAFFAGMTLPLFTMALLRRGWGEASIGRIYAANTLGAILGVALAVHVLIPLLGLRLAVTLAAVVDILLGVLLLKVYAAEVTPRPFRFAVLASVAVLGGSLLLGQLDPRALASGVFRHGQASLSDSARIEFFRDGKTSSVAVVASGTIKAIVTNGKSDAALQMDLDAPPSADEATMAMLAILPLAAHPAPRDIAVIGWGSGMSTDLLLASAAPRRVETIEIERAMHEGARLFGDRVARAYDDPRSHVIFDDARTYFSTGRKRYDVIVSEPSNPWVSGVGSLFTREFYRLLRGHLQPSGLVVQWLHSYELDDPLLMTMLAALLLEFPHVEAYASHGTDLILLAGMAPIGEPDLSHLADEPMAGELRRLGLAEPGDLAARKVGNQDTLAALVSLYAAEPHSDFHPVVALHAPRARFIGSRAVGLDTVASAGLPLLEITGGRRPLRDEQVVSPLSDRRGATDYWNALYLREALLENRTGRLQEASPEAVAHVRFLKSAADAPVGAEHLFDWLTAASVAAEFSIAFLRPVDQTGLWVDPAWVHGEGQPEVVRRVLAAYAAAALRSPDMREKGLSALALLDERDPAITREHMLVIAMLGAVVQGDIDAVRRIEQDEGQRVPAHSYRMGRAFLQALARLPATLTPTPSPAS